MFPEKKSTAFLVAAFLFSMGEVGFAAPQSQACEQQLSRAAKEEGVPIGVLYAVALNESGKKGKLHPFALNIHGKGVFAKNIDEAMQVFQLAQGDGKTLIDVGCMQVNHYYHGKGFKNVREMFDPEKNVTYAAKFLKRLLKVHGSWTMAVARYHAGPKNKVAQKRYICGVIRHLVATQFGSWTPEAEKFCKKA